ncbi:MAG: nucleoside-diphosphate kinase [Candidatus Bilamarchaeaceae archaeon]
MSGSMNARERTLILLKPDAIQRGLVGDIISRFERKGLKIVGLKMLRMDTRFAKEHYAHLVNKPFYPDLEKFVTEHPMVAMVIEGKEAVEVVRLIVGPTNATKAPAGTIRGDLSNSTSRNVIHASDSKETAEKEIKRFFKDNELFEYKFMNEYYRYAADE